MKSANELQFVSWYVGRLQSVHDIVKPFGYNARVLFEISGGSGELCGRIQIGRPSGAAIDVSALFVSEWESKATTFWEYFMNQVQQYVELETHKSFSGLVTDKPATVFEALYVWAAAELVEDKLWSLNG